MKTIKILTTLSAVCVLMCSCGRAARVIKLANDIEHATDDERLENGQQQQTNVRYSIKGVVQYDNGRVVRLTCQNGPFLFQDANGLYLGVLTKESPVYENNTTTITEVYDLPDNSEYEYSFGETATRAFNVDGYRFVASWSGNTYYFNIDRQLR